MSIEIEQTYPSHAPDGFAIALDSELAKRIRSLGEHPHTSSECFSSTRPCFVEAAFFAALGVAVWIATLMYFG